MTDTFRKQYRPLTDSEKELMENIKIKAEELETLIKDVGVGKNNNITEIHLSTNKLEECVMWVVKAITK